MERLTRMNFTTSMNTSSEIRTASRANPHAPEVLKAVARRSFCTLATSSPANRPHVAGVLYASDDNVLYVSTVRTSRKARNIAQNPHVFVCVPVRRLPVGPPSSVQFAATAEILAPTDPAIVALVERGRLKAVTGHGELELPDGCFLRITPAATLYTYGLGLSLWDLIRHPLDAGGRVVLG